MCIGLAEHCYLVRIAFEPAKSLLKSGWLFEIDFFPVCKRTDFFPFSTEYGRKHKQLRECIVSKTNPELNMLIFKWYQESMHKPFSLFLVLYLKCLWQTSLRDSSLDKIHLCSLMSGIMEFMVTFTKIYFSQERPKIKGVLPFQPLASF